jgi:hypothetical protein
MKDLFSSAALFFPTVAGQSDPNRNMLVKELETLLDNSKFLSKGEKEKMRKVIPIFSDDIIEDLKQSLVRQNLRFLQNKMTESSSKK